MSQSVYSVRHDSDSVKDVTNAMNANFKRMRSPRRG